MPFHLPVIVFDLDGVLADDSKRHSRLPPLDDPARDDHNAEVWDSYYEAQVGDVVAPLASALLARAQMARRQGCLSVIATARPCQRTRRATTGRKRRLFNQPQRELTQRWLTTNLPAARGLMRTPVRGLASTASTEGVESNGCGLPIYMRAMDDKRSSADYKASVVQLIERVYGKGCVELWFDDCPAVVDRLRSMDIPTVWVPSQGYGDSVPLTEGLVARTVEDVDALPWPPLSRTDARPVLH